jgi:phosphotransferase system enzyme I (PtsP)
MLKAAKKRNKSISICGELAHEADYIPFLVGIGVTRFSIYPKFLPMAQKIISGLTISDAQKYASMLVSKLAVKEVREALKNLKKDRQLQ